MENGKHQIAEVEANRLAVKGASVVRARLEIFLRVGAKELVLPLDLSEEMVRTSSGNAENF